MNIKILMNIPDGYSNSCYACIFYPNIVISGDMLYCQQITTDFSISDIETRCAKYTKMTYVKL